MEKSLEYIIEHGFMEMINFCSILKNMAGNAMSILHESWIGNSYIKELEESCKKLHLYSQELEKYLNKEKEISNIDRNKLREMIFSLNEINLPNALTIVKRVFSLTTDVYDNLDKEGVHKWCQVFDQLKTKFEINLQRVSLKRIDIRTDLNNEYKIKPFEFNSVPKYKKSDEEIKEIINNLGEPIE